MNKKHQLLYSGYAAPNNGPVLDLYGTFSPLIGFKILSVKMNGEDIDLFPILKDKFIDECTKFLEKNFMYNTKKETIAYYHWWANKSTY